ncbi:MAG TPA: maleylpyruvate isomerase family mycothiol-dependent enzyme [Pseudonocardiaceae bacterium]|nr:maleylpyruvate isomerase family mycothiol-dependent enzyme [Pseudonocardiaceae bacterium]
MAPLHHDRYLDAVTTESALFVEALSGADLAIRVPTCPDWTLRELAQHVGQAHRTATGLVVRRATARPDFSAPRPAAPEDNDGLCAWLAAGASELVDSIRAAGPEAPVWTFSGDQNAGFWARRMAHETTVHRADAELALGRAYTLEADLAADAISEWLSLLGSPLAVQFRPELAELRGEGQILHLHATDPGLGEAGEWIVRRTPAGPAWEPGHMKGDVAVRGAVVDLLLVLMRRVRPGEAPITVLGDAGLLDHWLEHTRF